MKVLKKSANGNRISRKRTITCTLVMAITAMLLCAWNTFRNENGEGNANIVSSRTPIDTKKGGTVWTRSFLSGSNTTACNSSPIITDSGIYVVSRNVLYEMDFQGSIKRKLTLSAAMNSVCNMLWQDDFLYIPLSGGKMECIRLSTLTHIWTSESFGGQSLSAVYYHNGCIYAGTTSMSGTSGTSGVFYCLNASDGSTRWTYRDTDHPGGYYWSGAISYGNALYFAGDNGILVSHSLLTDEVYDTRTITENGQIRAGITYDSVTNSLFTASNDGKLHKITTDREGIIQNIQSADIISGAKTANCTSTPTIWNGRLYIGSSADSIGYLSVFDASTLSRHYTVPCGEYKEVKSSPLVSTAYASVENNQTVYVYFSCNAMPGGILYIKDSETTTSAKAETLYAPAKAQQFCLSSIASGKDGTLYYSNDSGTFFAVSEVDISSDRIPSKTMPPTISPTKKPSSTQKPPTVTGNKVKKPKAPKKIRYKTKNKKYRISWKKKTKGSQTIVYIRYNSGKWKKKCITKKNYCTIKKSKKKIRIRLCSRIRINKKWYYSSYTKTYRLKRR